MQVLTKNLLGLGQSKPVRQRKKAGVIFISLEQHLQIHQRRKDKEKATRQRGIKAKANSLVRLMITITMFLIQSY
jgi:hypothetical protein